MIHLQIAFLALAVMFFYFATISHIDAIKNDPICESARAALDTVNSQRETHHARR